MAAEWKEENKFVVVEGARRMRTWDDYAAQRRWASGGDAAEQGEWVIGLGAAIAGGCRCTRRGSWGVGGGVPGSTDGRTRSAGWGRTWMGADGRVRIRSGGEDHGGENRGVEGTMPFRARRASAGARIARAGAW